MRGRNKKMQRLNRGQTIAAEREAAESESERLQERKRLHRKRTRSVVMAALVLAILALLAYTTGKNVVQQYGSDAKNTEPEYTIKAEIVDEDNRGQVSTRVNAYIAQLEQDLADFGYTVTRVTLPTGTSRELYVDLSNTTTYFKVNIDRDTAVTAEDIDRVVRYLVEHDLQPTYADVRIEGRAYYK